MEWEKHGSGDEDANPIPQAPQAGIDLQQAAPRAGTGRQQTSSPSSAPVTTHSQSHLRRQALVASLGLKTLAEVYSEAAARGLERDRFFNSEDLARRAFSEASRHQWPDDCSFNSIDCQ